MKHLLKLLSALLVLTLFACEKDSETLKPDYLAGGLSIHGAKLYFESATSSQHSTGNQENQQQLEQSRLPKAPDWSKAYYKLLSNGQAVVVPLDLSRQVSYKLANERYEPLTGKVYMLLYKDTDNITRMEVVSRMPDLEYLNAAGKDRKFSGTVLVEDWQGNFLKRFEISRDKIRKYSASSGKGQAGYDVLSGTATNTVWCETITWYSCAYGGGEEYCHEMYSETNCWGSWDEGSAGGSNTDESHYWDEGGGGGGGDSSQLEPALEVIADQSIIEDPKANCIYEKLQNNPHFEGLISKFQNSAQYHVVFTVGDAKGHTGRTVWSGNTATIVIDKFFLDWQPAIWGATTFFHEAFHANLQQHAISTFGTVEISKWPKNINDMTLEELAGYVDRTAAGTGPWEKATHEFMARNIEEMAQGLYLFVRDNYPQTYAQVGSDLNNYRALALMGLKETTYWKAEVEAKNMALGFEAAWNKFASTELYDCFQ